MTDNIRTLKWCYTHDSDCEQYDFYAPDGDRITWIHLTGNVKLYGVKFSNGMTDTLKADTQIKVVRLK